MNIDFRDLFDNYSYVITINEQKYNRFQKIMNYYGFNKIQKHIGRMNRNSIYNCNNAHLDLLRYAKKNKLPYILIFEDDAVPLLCDKDILCKKLNYYLTDIPNECNGLQIGWCLYGDAYTKFKRKDIYSLDDVYLNTQKYISNRYFSSSEYGYYKFGSHSYILFSDYDSTINRSYADEFNYKVCKNFYSTKENLFGQSDAGIENNEFIHPANNYTRHMCTQTINHLILNKII